MSGGADERPRMVIRVVGDDRVASTRYRVLAHLGGLRAAGFDTEVEFQGAPPSALTRLPRRLAGLAADTWSPLAADLVLIHRRTYPPFFARRLRRSGVPLVFDLDDALYLPPPSASQDERTVARYRRNFEATASAADLVICGNREVARHVPHDRVEILPTPLDCDRFHPRHIAAPTAPVVGWVGHSDNLPYLESLAGPLRELARRYSDFRLVVVADRAPQIKGVPVDFRPWRLEDEVSCFSEMTVGLMPLEDSPWTRAKCAFKLLQYMALGIPAVAAPVGMNNEVVEDGHNALLAGEPDEWLRCVDRLLGDEGLRQRLAAAGRRTVEERYALDVTSPRLAALLRGLLDPSLAENPSAGPAGTP